MNQDIPPAATLFWQGAQPIVKIYVCYLTGAMLSRAGVLNMPATKVMAKALSHLFYPCLLFTRNVQGVDGSNIADVGSALAFLIIFMLIGIAGASILHVILPRSRGFDWAFCVANVWVNIGDIPFSFFLSFGDIPPFNRGDMALGMAITTMLGGPYNFSLFPRVGPRFLAKDVKDTKDAVETHSSDITRGAPSCIDDDILGDVVEEVAVDVGGAALEPPAEAEEVNLEDKELPRRWGRGRSLLHHRPYRRVWSMIRRHGHVLVTPMNTAVVLGLICALVPPLKSLFYSDDPNHTPPLGWLTVDLALIGAISLPLSCINMGAVITRGSFHSIPRIHTLATFLFRIILFPGIAIGLAYAACEVGWIGWERKALRMYILLIACAPSCMPSLLATQSLALDGVGAKASAMNAVLYVASLFTSVGYVYAMLRLLFND